MTDLVQSLQLALGDAFRIESELPGGGMSRVFVANESSLNRRVVIKVLPPELASEVSAARFKQEMEFAARLQHPHILPVLAAGAREGLLYYVMPFATGESLRHHMDREGRLSTSEAVRLVSEIADALAFAHGHGILHRDIKPQNILLEGKHAVLTDFGIARALAESRTGDRLTITGVAVGTPGYMSPEQLAGEDLDARADVYALAVVAYEMISGSPPFTGPTAQAVLAAHLTQPARPLHEVDASIPRALSDVIARALSKNMADRFANAAAFGEALKSAELEPSRSQEIPKTARPSVLRIAVPVLGALLIAILLGRAAVQRSHSRQMLSALTPAADSQDFDEVARLLGETSLNLARSSFGSIVPRVAGFLVVTSTPPDAEITITRTTPLDSFPHRQPVPVGRTPLETRSLVAGEYLIRLTSPGHDTVALVANVVKGDTTTVRAQLLDTTTNPGMVLVSEGTSDSGVVVPAFVIGSHETTNAEFQRFVDDGGYRNATLWLETMVIDGRELPREVALARFVDATGLPGPRKWNAGRFPAEKANHPVTDVTWYEASAYARWAGGALPTPAQWWRAAQGDAHLQFPWGTDGTTIESRANFGLNGTEEVGKHPLGVSPFGAYDLAGNVAEWLAEDVAPRHQRMVVGGSWKDPSYMFERSAARLFEPGVSSEIIGFRIVKQAPAVSR